MFRPTVSRLTALLDRYRLRHIRLRPEWIKGIDTRSPAERLHDLRIGEPNIVHVFGDSQAYSYAQLPSVVVHALPGTTMHRVARDGAWFLRRLRRRMGQRSTLVFVFGGVDARRHIGRIAEESGQPIDMVAQRLVAGYLDSLAAERQGRRVIVVGVLPPASEESIHAAFGSWGTQQQRATVSLALNMALADGCAARGFGFVDQSRDYADARGYLHAGLTYDGVHLTEEARRIAVENVRFVLVKELADSDDLTAG
jgi:hypothetical protein